MTIEDAIRAAYQPPEPLPEYLTSAAPDLFEPPEPEPEPPPEPQPPPEPELFPKSEAFPEVLPELFPEVDPDVLPPYGGFHSTLDELDGRTGGGGGGSGGGENPDYPDNGGKGITLFYADPDPPPESVEAGPLTQFGFDRLIDGMVARSPGAPPDDPGRTTITCFDGTRIGRVVVRRIHQLTEVYTGCTPGDPLPGQRVDGHLWQDPNASVELRFDAGDNEITGW